MKAQVLGQRGFTLIETMVVMVLLGLATLATVGIMSAMTNAMNSDHNRMSMSTYGLELSRHLDMMDQTNGIGFCMQYPTLLPDTLTSVHSRSLGQMLNAQPNQVRNMISKAKAVPSDKANALSLDRAILFEGDSIYGGTSASPSADFMTLIDAKLHSFTVRKNISAYVVDSPRVINVLGTGSQKKQEYMYLVSAIFESRFYRGNVPSNVNNMDVNRIATSRIPVNLAIRNYKGTHSVVDCGTHTLIRTTAFAESCRTLGAEFEYVVDKPGGVSGQCYAPKYYSSAMTVNGDNVGQIMRYAPIRHFLCEASFAGKSLNVPYCTGEF